MSLFGTLTAIGGAIATAASTIGAPVAGLASAMGASAGTAATAGSIAGSAAIGSASGAALSAATGGDPGQGALFGALTGGVGAGAGAALGAAGGSTGGAAGGITGSAGQAATAAQPSVSAITQGVASPGFQQAATGIQGAAEVAAAEPSVSAVTQGIGSPAFQQASQAAANNAGVGGLGSLLNNDTVKSVGVDLAKEGIGSGVQNMQAGAQSRANNRNAIAAIQSGEQQRKSEDEALNRKMNTLYGGLNQGRGIGMAKGGEVGLQEGQFIIPADVVSALGNGSTKAGAKFLDEFFKA